MVDRVSRYLARVDAQLPALADDGARRGFLLSEREKWFARYERFTAAIDRGDDAPGTAPDYLLTIAGIDARAAQFGPRP